MQAPRSTPGPITNKRTLESNVVVEDGTSSVLGGLIEDDGGDSVRQGAGARRHPGARRPVPLRDAHAQEDQPDGVPASRPWCATRQGRRARVRPLRLHAHAAHRRRGAREPRVPRVHARADSIRRAGAQHPAAGAMPPSSGPASGAYAASQSSAAPSGRVQLIQVTTLSDVAAARDTQRKLRDAGFDAYWESVPTAQGDSVRIRVAVDTARTASTRPWPNCASSATTRYRSSSEFSPRAARSMTTAQRYVPYAFARDTRSCSSRTATRTPRCGSATPRRWPRSTR